MNSLQSAVNRGERYLSLDVMRGLVIAMMIVVNTPGSWSDIYPPLEHAVWLGCTPTDWVFPSFLFLVGMSMRFSFKKYDYRLTWQVMAKIMTRGIILYGVYVILSLFWKCSGALIAGKPLDYAFFERISSHFRYFGVFPRIALVYVLGSLLALLTGTKKKLIVLILFLLLGYWAIMYYFGDYQQLTNAAHRLDLYLLGKEHLWQGEGFPYEPEGLLSTMPAIATSLLGYLCAIYIQMAESKSNLVKKLIIVGAMGIGMSELWNLSFPISKKMWTSSFVLQTTGVDLLVLAILIWHIDLKGRIRGTFFWKVFGMNALMAYVVSELPIPLLSYWKISYEGSSISAYSFIYKSVFLPLSYGDLRLASLLFALSWMFLCWLVLYGMYRKGIFWKI
ncbi:MAG: acyltransferase family protein [Saprospiraceae bacterium]